MFAMIPWQWSFVARRTLSFAFLYNTREKQKEENLPVGTKLRYSRRKVIVRPREFVKARRCHDTPDNHDGEEARGGG